VVNYRILFPSNAAYRCFNRPSVVFRWSLVAILSAACSAMPNGKATGGVNDDAATGCPAGVAAVLGDSSYSSSQVALLGLDGNVLSSSFISTASTTTDGLAFALSGDIALPTTAPASGRIVILDRYGTNVVTWVDTATAKAQAQLPVGTGFESNPQDYLEIADDRALLSRWGLDGNPGDQPSDGGNDLLLVDNELPRIQARIAIPGQDDLPPRPASLTRLGNSVAVVLQRYSEDFSVVGDSEIVRVDLASLQIVQTLLLSGVSNCGRVMSRPGTSSYAMACTGPLDANGGSADLSRSALVRLDVDSQGNLAERSRILAADIAQEPLQNDFDFANDHVALVKTQTPLLGSTNNRLLAVDLNDESVRQLAAARPDSDGKGQGAKFGSVLCAPGCSSLCLLADADQAAIRRFDVSRDTSVELDPVDVTPGVALMPRQLAHFGGVP
jgi:hypothetical protein